MFTLLLIYLFARLVCTFSLNDCDQTVETTESNTVDVSETTDSITIDEVDLSLLQSEYYALIGLSLGTATIKTALLDENHNKNAIMTVILESVYNKTLVN